ncbi:MAG TPA: glutamate-1-semialdehyde 2,1-aminomutase [Jatrophihabitans sp.]|uniref:glutamate-1-semialdehyde 2,1-aminomutase n=1 Tax=Jatrophihabitans sp. TaxID=1932789 RepID=UPI002DFD535F|nr:glutamate-1-semialdehyde 2,1-aminomutase [Jatrophihabitans sp.]
MKTEDEGSSEGGVTPAAERFAASTAHTAAVKRLIPGGAHTYAKGDDQYPEGMAPIIERGWGCHVRDIDGNEYIEYGSGLRSVTLGHGYEPVVEAVRRSIGDGVNFVRPHVLEREAAERLVDLIPSAEMVKFGLNGSDTTTGAVKLARAYTGRGMIAACRQHPMLSVHDWFMITTPMAAGIPTDIESRTVQFDYNDPESLARLFAQYPGKIAAVILEAETIEPPAPGFFAALRRLCDENGALLILDEIITGFRWHERGAQFIHGIKPDLCTFGKAMANGFPLSALAGRREVMRLGGFVDDVDRVFLVSLTAGAEPWALAAMLAVIETYEREQIAERLMKTGAELRAGLEQVIADAGLADHLQLAGRDCNLVYVARDAAGAPSQIFRTLFLQEIVSRGVLAPSFVVGAAHDAETTARTIEIVAAALPAYRRGLEDGPEAVLRGRPVRPAIRPRG